MKQLRERLLIYGTQTLLTEELLALVLRTGSADEKGYEQARKLLATYGGLGGLLQVEYKELMQEHGLSETRAALLKAVLELGRRLNWPQQGEKYQIKTPADAANLVMLDMAYLDYEQLRVIVLDTRNRVVDNIPLYRGTINSSVLRAAEIFRWAIVRNCPAIIICHSHPSGDPSPSDVIWRKICQEQEGMIGKTCHTFQRGLRPDSPTLATRSHPHRLSGHARDLRACASTAPSTPVATPTAVDQSA